MESGVKTKMENTSLIHRSLKMADQDEVAELKHHNRQLKRMLHEEYEKRMALEKEERKICRAIIKEEMNTYCAVRSNVKNIYIVTKRRQEERRSL
jgi:hypothetical protein